MADKHSKEIRSYNMSRIKNRNTKPEMLVRKFLFGKGFRFRLHDSKLPGKPDVILPKFKTIIFINGCFWHGYENCKYFTIPKTNTEWWSNKIDKNKQRDLLNNQELIKQNWRIITIFGCELKSDNAEATLLRIVAQLQTHTLSS